MKRKSVAFNNSRTTVRYFPSNSAPTGVTSHRTQTRRPIPDIQQHLRAEVNREMKAAWAEVGHISRAVTRLLKQRNPSPNAQTVALVDRATDAINLALKHYSRAQYLLHYMKFKNLKPNLENLISVLREEYAKLLSFCRSVDRAKRKQPPPPPSFKNRVKRMFTRAR